ncbi:Peptidyl-tRNA hydrolase [subsurface metagenome]
MKLIVGLGNPGRTYANNRHNLGFICLNHFARTQGIRFDKKQGQARTGSGEVAGSKVVLAKPQTYMNLSGQSVSRLIKRFNIDLGDLLVVHDDLDLPLGKIRIRRGGSAGGHKGINSIISELESQDFSRLKIGVGHPVVSSPEISEADIITYVLNDFTPEETEVVTQVVPRVSEAILCLLTEGLTAAMNKYN